METANILYASYFKRMFRIIFKVTLSDLDTISQNRYTLLDFIIDNYGLEMQEIMKIL